MSKPKRLSDGVLMGVGHPEPSFNTPANFVNFAPNGVAHYRTYLPARELKASMFVRDQADLSIVKQLGPQDTPVVIYSMPRNEEMIDECQQLLDNDVKLVVDIDDYLRSFIGKKDHPSWKVYTDEYVKRHEDMIRKATLVTTTTPWLRERLLMLNDNVMIVPNGLDLERWRIKREPRHKKFTIIGWSGSVGHTDAVKKVAPVLSRILRERDDVAVATAGMPIGGFIDEDVQHRIHDTLFHPIFQHPKVLTQFHINIGPTVDSEFYSAKSPLRALEAWASDSAFIGGSNTYGDLIRDGEDGLLADSEDEWYDRLNMLIDDRGLQRELRKEGDRRVREEGTIQATAPAWDEAISVALDL